MTATIRAAPRQGLHAEEVHAFVRQALSQLELDGRSLCLVIPDATRACPLPLLLDAIEAAVAGRVRSCIGVIALGTHAPMTEPAILAMAGDRTFSVINHEWWREETFAYAGQLDALMIGRLSEGRLHEPVDIRINRLVMESDVTLLIGPVLPHEVVGFSGGNKYLFPGLSGPELIDVTHWLGALITSREIIGSLHTTPVRALIDAAAGLVPKNRHALCAVADRDGQGLHALSFGDPREAWAASATIAAQTHIEYVTQPVRRVLSVIPTRYPDLWTGAKGFYKVEPIVAEGGEVVLYAPHITEVAAMHPGILKLGYHCRDYFLAHWDTYQDTPRGDLAHSTHLFGAGTYDAEAGERQRVHVTLATGIPERIARHVNLGYLDHRSVDIGRWAADADTLVVPDAGEVLYRLGHQASVPQP